MKAVEFNEYGGPDVLRLAEVDLPRPGSGEVRIKVHAAGVNPSDWKRREGRYRAFEGVVFPFAVQRPWPGAVWLAVIAVNLAAAPFVLLCTRRGRFTPAKDG